MEWIKNGCNVIRIWYSDNPSNYIKYSLYDIVFVFRNMEKDRIAVI